jgi:hypothetical protein
MRRVSIPFLILPIILLQLQGFSTEVDVVVGHTADHLSGNIDDGGALRTRARLSASANLYRSDPRSPVITTRAWIWSFPAGFDPAAGLRSVPGGDPPGMEIFTWGDDDQRMLLLDTEGVRVLELPEIDSVPGMMSRWSSASDGRWAVAITPKLLEGTVVARPHIQWAEDGAESPETVVRSLPAVHLSGGESRLLRIPVNSDISGDFCFLELQSYFGWEGTPPRVRQRTYTGSWTDRIDVGGQLELEGVYTNGASTYPSPR